MKKSINKKSKQLLWLYCMLIVITDVTFKFAGLIMVL